ncbi:MAG: hypothetical protein AB2A00_41830 [Myxococcota bacterium]
MGSPKPTVQERCAGLPWQACLQLYAEMIRDAPDATPVLARALRDKARAGDIPDEAIPVLVCCLVDTNNAHALAQLAKTLAAFGHKAGMAAPYLVQKIRALTVTSDETFWALDGCLHALSHLGGTEPVALLDELGTQDPPLVTRARKLYQGVITEEDRRKIFAETLEVARARLEKGKGGGWKKKRTDRAATESQPKGKTAPWMTR